MKLEVNIAKKHFFILLTAILLLAVTFGVYAHNSGGPPSVMGHSAEELEGVCKTADATTCPASLGFGSYASYKEGCSGTFTIPEKGNYIFFAKATLYIGDINYIYLFDIDATRIDESMEGDYAGSGGKGGGSGAVPLIGYVGDLTQGAHSFSIRFRQDIPNSPIKDSPGYCDFIVMGPFG